jgi:hypothetical protein
MLQPFLICGNLGAQYMHRFHHQSVPPWPPHRKLGIYVGYHSPLIIKFLELLTRDLFTARYADCIFNEDHFLALGEITSPSYPLIHVQKKLNFKFRKIINLQNVANNLSDAFNDYKGATKSWYPVVNAPDSEST